MKNKRNTIFTLFLILTAALPFSVSAAEITLESILHRSLDNGEEQVTFLFDTGPSKPKRFTLQGQRPRLVLDFDNVKPSSGLGNRIELNTSLIETLRLGIHPTDNGVRTRVVFDMTPETYKHSMLTDESAHALTILISPDTPKPVYSAQSPQPEKKQPAPKPVTPAAPLKQELPAADLKRTIEEPLASSSPTPDKKQSPLITAVTYNEDKGKGEMILFRLNGFHPPIVYGVEEGLPRAVCDFKQTDLAEGVKRIQDIAGKYVRSIRIGKHANPDKVRVVVDLEPNNNYDLQQVFFKKDNLFVIIVNTIKE